jgi:peptide/nickel transport system ATP-binding protein
LGLEKVQSGSIEIDGLNVSESAEARARMQVVFQDPYGSFNPRYQISKTLAEPFHILKKRPSGDTIDAALVEVGLSPSDKHKYPHEFSGGQRQRIAIARALIIKPDLIILDEAVSALDVSIRAQILDLLAELSKTHHLTYLFISHDLSVVRSITDRCLVMKAGEIVEQGPTEQVFTDPQHPYTKALIAAAPLLPDA